MNWRRKLAQRALERQLAYQQDKAQQLRGHEDEQSREREHLGVLHALLHEKADRPFAGPLPASAQPQIGTDHWL